MVTCVGALCFGFAMVVAPSLLISGALIIGANRGLVALPMVHANRPDILRRSPARRQGAQSTARGILALAHWSASGGLLWPYAIPIDPSLGFPQSATRLGERP